MNHFLFIMERYSIVMPAMSKGMVIEGQGTLEGGDVRFQGCVLGTSFLGPGF
jgi:hypothetical protein